MPTRFAPITPLRAAQAALIAMSAATLALGVTFPPSACSKESTSCSTQYATVVGAVSLDEAMLNRIADAIYRVEGGSKTQWPYGVKLAHGKRVSAAEARVICKRTVQHAWRDFNFTNNAGVSSSGSSPLSPSLTPAFIDFLANRYCPVQCDRLGNARWKSNMKKILHLEYGSH